MSFGRKPHWNGKTHNVDLNKCLLPFMMGQPLFLQLENCDDYFLPVFTTPENLHDALTKMGYSGYDIKQVTDAEEFLDSLREGGVRVMLNPQIIDAHHTKWLEVVKKGEEYLFIDQELN